MPEKGAGSGAHICLNLLLPLKRCGIRITKKECYAMSNSWLKTKQKHVELGKKIWGSRAWKVAGTNAVFESYVFESSV